MRTNRLRRPSPSGIVPQQILHSTARHTLRGWVKPVPLALQSRVGSPRHRRQLGSVQCPSSPHWAAAPCHCIALWGWRRLERTVKCPAFCEGGLFRDRRNPTPPQTVATMVKFSIEQIRELMDKCVPAARRRRPTIALCAAGDDGQPPFRYLRLRWRRSASADPQRARKALGGCDARYTAASAATPGSGRRHPGILDRQHLQGCRGCVRGTRVTSRCGQLHRFLVCVCRRARRAQLYRDRLCRRHMP